MKLSYIFCCVSFSLIFSAGELYAQVVPNFKNEVEKAEWIKNNPEIIKTIQNEPVLVSSEVNDQNSKTTEVDPNYSLVNLPGFPVYKNTGNAEEDAKAYEGAKLKWISENEKSYADLMEEEKLVSSDEYERVLNERLKNNSEKIIDPISTEENSSEIIHVISKEEFETMPVEKQQHILNNTNLYNIKAIDENIFDSENKPVVIEYENQSREKHFISEGEFEKMPNEKKEHILNNPSLYKIEDKN